MTVDEKARAVTILTQLLDGRDDTVVASRLSLDVDVVLEVAEQYGYPHQESMLQALERLQRDLVETSPRPKTPTFSLCSHCGGRYGRFPADIALHETGNCCASSTPPETAADAGGPPAPASAAPAAEGGEGSDGSSLSGTDSPTAEEPPPSAAPSETDLRLRDLSPLSELYAEARVVGTGRMVRLANKAVEAVLALDQALADHATERERDEEIARLEARLTELRNSGKAKPTGTPAGVIRGWAAKNNISCAAGGPIPRRVMQAYLQSHPAAGGGS